jgi:tetratricopeptide (TPR) repeat protein
MEIAELIKHPEHLDRDTLYELRSMLALYPYFQTARLLLLQNLYLLHDPSFDEELRRAAIYITDRRVLFQMIEAAHYKLMAPQAKTDKPGTEEEEGSSRTLSLIDNFLETIPKNDEKEEADKPRRKPTPADAAVDYVAYLLETEEETPTDAPQAMKGQHLIDNFIDKEQGKIQLKETPEFLPPVESTAENTEKDADEGFYTETLARIYIKQGKYSKALEIIKRLNLNNPKKSVYFADQIRFLEKLIINNNKK